MKQSPLKYGTLAHIRELGKNEKFKQVVMLYSVNVAGIPIGIVTSIILTRFLGPQVYGDYNLLHNIFQLSTIIFTFGLFQAGNRAILLSSNITSTKEYYGTAFFIFILLSFIMMTALYIYGAVDTNLTEKGLQRFFFIIIPFSFIFLLLRYFETLFQADNQISMLAATRFFPKVAFLITTVFVYLGYVDYKANNLALIWFFYVLSCLSVYIIIIAKIKISFRNVKKRLQEFVYLNRTFGFHVYIGSLFAVGLNLLTGILISYFSYDNTGLGYYALALTFASPLALIPNVIATTHYKDFSTEKKISKQLILITALLSLGCLLLMWVIVGPFIKYFYGENFLPVIGLNFIVSLGVIFHGFADFFNRFLGAHGKGKALRNSSIIVGLSLLILNLTLIPQLGERGAAYTKICSGLIYLFIMINCYKLLTKELE